LNRLRHRGSFATGLEQEPEENVERRVYAPGGFSVVLEEDPEDDAAKRAHPGTFADTEPIA
jgi:hypothetical protein